MNDLFDGGDQPQIDPTKDYYSELVGEGKKYKDNQSLARSKAEADATIEIFKRQMDTLREDYLQQSEELKTRAQLQELIDQFKPAEQHTPSSTTTPANDEIKKPAFDPNQIRDLIREGIQETETNRKQQANADLVRDKLKEKFGNNYQAVLQEQMDSMGLNKEFVNNLARSHPQVLFKTLGLDQPVQTDNFQAPPRSDRRSDNFSPSTQKRTWTYYQNLRKENPNLYNSPKVNLQMIEDYKNLGDAFEDGDFNMRGRS